MDKLRRVEELVGDCDWLLLYTNRMQPIDSGFHGEEDVNKLNATLFN